MSLFHKASTATQRLDQAAVSPSEPREQERYMKRGLAMGLASGLVAISCCVSPVVLVLLGVATAAEAVSLGDTLYYTYGWLFRGAGLLVATVAVVLYLRRRRSCNLRGVRQYRGMLLTLLLAGSATYAGLFWFTRYLGIWFG